MENKLKSIKTTIFIQLFAVISFLTSTVIYYNSGDKIFSLFNLLTTVLLSVGLIINIKKYKNYSLK